MYIVQNVQMYSITSGNTTNIPSAGWALIGSGAFGQNTRSGLQP